MHFEYNPDRDGKRTVTLVKGEELIPWSIAKLAKNDVNVELIIRDINAYWKTLPDVKLDKLWEVMVTISDLIENSDSKTNLSDSLKEQIAIFYTEMDYQSVEDWVINNSTIKIPNDQLSDEYSINAPNNRLTYLRYEYMQLLALATLIRPMMGVFGKYISYVDISVGTNRKELSALYLLSESPVVETAPYLRLLEYVTVISSSIVTPMDALLQGMGSEELPMWLMGFALVRRLPFCELPDTASEDTAHHVVSNIYNYVDGKCKAYKVSFGGNVRDKHLRGRSDQQGGIDNTPSVAENYKMTEDVSEGDVIIAEIGMGNLRNIVLSVDITVPTSLIDTCEEFYSTRRPQDLAADNLHLVKYVLNKNISIALIPLPENNIDKMAIATCILLWHWGLYDLAALATGARRQIPTSVFIGSVKLKLELDQLTALDKIYPHALNLKTQGARKSITDNTGIRAIEALSSYFSASGWRLRVPPKLQRELSFTKNQYASVVPETIKLQLADMIIKLHSIGSL